MKYTKDYLWDKTGNDTEIERFEKALAVFRMKNSEAPELTLQNSKTANPASSSIFETSGFRYALAGFACLSLAVFSIGIFLFLNSEEAGTAQKNNMSSSNDLNDEKPLTIQQDDQDETESDEFDAQKPKVVKTVFKPKPSPKRKFVKVKSVRQKEKSKDSPAKQDTVKPGTNAKPIYLTKEEKEAYEKLREALAITGTQFRFVREKIRGEESRENIERKKEKMF